MYQTTIEPCDLELLRDPTQKGFIDELRSAHLYLQPNQAEEYYQIVLSLLNKKKISNKTGHELIHSLCRVISKEAFLQTFIENLDKENGCYYYEELPFIDDGLINDVFDVLYILVTRSPKVFNSTLLQQFKDNITTETLKKSLVILTKYAQVFNEISNPYPMLKILLEQHEIFSSPEICDEYAALLGILVRLYPEFRHKYGRAVWEKVCQLVSVPTDKATICKIYDSLSNIAQAIRHVENAPYQTLVEQLEQKDNEILYEPILKFLLVIPLEPEYLKEVTFLQHLLRIAQGTDENTNYHALLVLCRLAEDKTVARLLVEQNYKQPTKKKHDSEEPEEDKNICWLDSTLPTLADTMTLFLVVFQHRHLRPEIARLDVFYDFLYNYINKIKKATDDYHPSEYFLVVCKIIDGFNLNSDSESSDGELIKDVVKHLSANNIITLFMDKVFKAQNRATSDDTSRVSDPETIDIIQCSLHFLQTISQATYTKELPTYCDWLTDMIVEKQLKDLTAPYSLAFWLAKRRHCLERFRADGRLIKCAKKEVKNSSKSKYDRLAGKFLKLID